MSQLIEDKGPLVRRFRWGHLRWEYGRIVKRTLTTNGATWSQWEWEKP